MTPETPPPGSIAPQSEPSQKHPTVALADHRMDVLWAAHLEAQKSGKRTSVVSVLAGLGLLTLHLWLGVLQGTTGALADDTKVLKQDVKQLLQESSAVKAQLGLLIELHKGASAPTPAAVPAAPKGRP